MRNAKTRVVDDLGAVQEEVEVDRPGPPSLHSLPSKRPLDREERVEELARGERRLECSSAVQEAGLIDDADGIGLAELGDGEHVDPVHGREQLDRLLESPPSVTEVCT